MNVTFKQTGIYSPSQIMTNQQKPLNKADSDKSENKEKISANLDKHAEEKTRLEQLREQKQQKYDSVIQQLEKQREAEKQAEKSGKKFTDYGKLLKIAMRIMNGDKVPMTDRKKLAEEMPDLYKQAILMRRLDNDKPKKYKSEYEDDKDKNKRKDDDDEGMDTDIESNVDDSMEKGKTGAKKSGGGKAKTDSDGYMAFKMPWSLTFGYGVTMREDTRREKFNEKSMRYPYKFTQNLNMSGNVRISDGWNISFSSGYDFDNHKLSMTTASLARDLHCFNMSCSVVLAPYTSYNFTFRCNAATLTDALKYDKRSGYSNAVQWY